MSELDPLFSDGPEGFLRGPLSRCRRFVCAQNGLSVAEGTLPPKPAYPAPEPHGHAHSGGPPWQDEATTAIHGLWSGDSRDVQAVFGVPAPAILPRFEAACQGAATYTTFQELRLDARPMGVPPEEENLFEKLVLNDQLNPLGAGLAGAFAGLVPVAGLGDGDSYHIEVQPPDESAPNTVLIWHHGQRHFYKVSALSLEPLVFLSALCKAVDEDQVSEETAEAAFAALHGKVGPTWHLGMDDYAPDFEPFVHTPGSSWAMTFFYRARWIFELLRDDQVGEVEELAGAFYENLNPVVSDEQVERRLESLRERVPTALYACWRAYLFDEPPLERYLSAARSHRARLVRDCAALIDALRAGRTRLGRIANWPKRLAQFRALDLDPRHAALREAKAEAEAARSVQRQAALAAELPTAGATEGLARAAEVFLTPGLNQVALEALMAAPERAALNRALRFLIDGLDARDGRSHPDEEMDAVRAAAQVLDPTTALCLLGIALKGSQMPEGRRPLDGRKAGKILVRWSGALPLVGREALVQALDGLDGADKLNTWQVELVPELAGALGVRECGPSINRLLAQIPDQGGVGTALAYDAFVGTCADALAKLGTPDLAQLLRFAKGDELRMRQARGRCALALARLAPDALDLAVCQNLNAFLWLNSADENVWSLLAIARAPIAADALAPLEPGAESYPQVKVALALAQGTPVQQALENALRHSGYNNDSDLASRRLALLAVDCCALRVHEEALRLAMGLDPELDGRLAALGALEPPTWYTRFQAEDMTVPQRVQAMGELGSFGREAIARTLVGVPEARAPLERTLMALCEKPKVRGRLGYLSEAAVVALLSLPHAGSTEAVFAWVLENGGPDHWDPILREPPTWPGLKAGMARIAAQGRGWKKSTAEGWLKANAG